MKIKEQENYIHALNYFIQNEKNKNTFEKVFLNMN
jgi:hypothetical protein